MTSHSITMGKELYSYTILETQELFYSERKNTKLLPKTISKKHLSRLHLAIIFSGFLKHFTPRKINFTFRCELHMLIFQSPATAKHSPLTHREFIFRYLHKCLQSQNHWSPHPGVCRSLAFWDGTNDNDMLCLHKMHINCRSNLPVLHVTTLQKSRAIIVLAPEQKLFMPTKAHTTLTAHQFIRVCLQMNGHF